MEVIAIPLNPVLTFVVVLARMGGLVTFAPFWSHRAAPAKVRILLALILAFVVTPIVAGNIPAPPTDFLGLAIVIAGELLIGCALGFVGRLVFSALEMAAHVVGFQMGFSLASTIDPATRAQTAALGTIAQMLGLVMFLGINGHHWMLAVMVKSFRTTAPGNFSFTPQLAELFIRLSADAIAVGVSLAAPAIVVLLTVELGLAIAGRAAPQLQIMILGFPIKIMVGLWLIGASLYFMPGAMRTVLNSIRTGMEQVLRVI